MLLSCTLLLDQFDSQGCWWITNNNATIMHIIIKFIWDQIEPSHYQSVDVISSLSVLIEESYKIDQAKAQNNLHTNYSTTSTHTKIVIGEYIWISCT